MQDPSLYHPPPRPRAPDSAAPANLEGLGLQENSLTGAVLTGLPDLSDSDLPETGLPFCQE